MAVIQYESDVNVRGKISVVGGLTSQFLKANGDIDSNSYALASTVHNSVTLGTANGLSLSVQQLSLGLASSGVTGALSGTDWNTFNNKANANGSNAAGVWQNSSLAIDNISYTNANQQTLAGLRAFNNTTGSTNFPNTIGTGIEVKRSAPSLSSVGSFQLWSSNSGADDDLYFRKVTNFSTTEVWSTWRKIWTDDNLTNPVTGTGTTNRLTKFTAAGVIGNSNISDDGTIISLITDATVNGHYIGRGAGNSATNLSLGSNPTSSTGINNLFIAELAGNANTSGAANVAVGRVSLYHNTTGSNNIALGVLAGRWIADAVTNLNIVSNGVFLGYRSRALADNSTNEIVIGADAIGNGDNSATLGNSSITKTILRGRVLFGTTTDNLTDKVQINGSAIATAWKVTGGLVTQYQTGTGTIVDFNTSVRGATLTGFVLGANTALANTDTIEGAFGKVQAQINIRATTNGSNATGTWGINTTGQSGSSLLLNPIVYADANQGNTAGLRNILNTPGSVGFPSIAGAGIEVMRNPPSSSSVGSFQLWSSNVGTDDSLYLRRITNFTTVNTWGNWKKILDTESVLTGFVSGAGTVAATDTILQAINKLDGNINAKVSNATHTGEVTGATALTIENNVVTNAKLAQVATGIIKGRVTAATGNVEDLTAAQVRTLINVADGANNYVHPTGDGNLHVPATGTTNNGKVLTAGATAGSLSWTTVAGSAQATSTVLGTVKLFSDTAQATAANAVSATASRTYGIQLNASGQAVVNVPWSDTNTWTQLTGTVSGFVPTQGASSVNHFLNGNAGWTTFGTTVGTIAQGNDSRFTDARTPLAHTLDSHSNVIITANVAGEILKWDGTAWINNTLAEAGIAGLVSPAFSGVPTAPTAVAGTNTTQIATTAFVIANALSLSANQSFTGIKSTTGSGTSQVNGFSLSNNGTTSNSAPLSTSNSNSGAGIYSTNSGTGAAIEISNFSSSTGKGLNVVNTNAGLGIGVSNQSTGIGISVSTSSSGTALRASTTSTGIALIIENGPTGTGLNISSQNNGTPTFTVDKLGVVTATAHVTTGGTVNQFVDGTGALQNISAIGRPYKVYTALLSQIGTNAPTATVLENTLGGTVVWTRTGVGIYNATLNGAFTTNKTIIFISQPTYNWYETISWLNTNILNSNTRKAGVLSDDVFSNSSVEIRVYL